LGARIECLETDEAQRELIPLQPVQQPELFDSHARELRWPAPAPAHSPWRERICNLVPGLVETRQDVWQDTERYLIHGLEFARVAHVSTRPRASFGVATGRQAMGEDEWPMPAEAALSEENFDALAALVRLIETHRTANPPARRHPAYRLRAEAWLESLLRRDIQLLDESLDPRFVYSQIPAWQAEDRSVIDLLAVSRAGRLVVIEIKASEDMNLPLQGLDYWMRVEQARRRGEFTRRGLFPGLELAAAPALLYLVAPRLRFHRTFTRVARCLAPEIAAYQLGLNAGWREGVRVHTKDRVNDR
ncbi:MAG: hypothetical protein ACKV2V_23300, partial [Blastocatellia bacterium]